MQALCCPCIVQDVNSAGNHLDAANKERGLRSETTGYAADAHQSKAEAHERQAGRDAQASAEHGATAVGHGITDAAARAAGTVQGTFDKVRL
jgi:hypothetical protein